MKAIVKVVVKTEIELDNYYTTDELKEYLEDHYMEIIYPINMLTNFRVIEYGVRACTD